MSENVDKKRKNKIYIYTRVSTAMQVDGYSLDAQRSRMKADGTKYKDFFYHGCKHRQMTRGHKCTYKKQINEELLDDAVAEIIAKLVSNPKFASMMQKKINMEVDTSAPEPQRSPFFVPGFRRKCTEYAGKCAVLTFMKSAK